MKFKDKLAESNIAELLAPYHPGTLLVECLKRSEGTFAGFEALIVAVANVPMSILREVREEDLLEIIRECDKLKAMGGNRDTMLVRTLRMIRNIRPAWVSAPVYRRILSPFNEQVKNICGYSIEAIFQDIIDVNDATEESGAFPDTIQALEPHLRITTSEISEVEDLWNCGIVEGSGFKILLTYKISDVVYRTICKLLLAQDPRFANKRGKSLERVTRNLLEESIPSWKVTQNYFVEGREKDLLIENHKMGIAVECKGFAFRASSADWSTLNAESDSDPVRKGLEQLVAPMKVLREGGQIEIGGKSRTIPPMEISMGFVITDEVNTSYLRANIDGLGWTGEPDEEGKEWHGTDIWIGSIIDLYFFLKYSGSFSIFIDYLRKTRSDPKIRFTDEPESWDLYKTDPILPVVSSMDAKIMASGFDWKRIRAEPSVTQPIWLERMQEVQKLDSQGRPIDALRYISQDREKTRRFFKKKWAERKACREQ